MKIAPLRGRVVIRPDRPTRIGSIHLPDHAYDNARERDREQGIKARSSHTGTVIAMGPPARTKAGAEVPYGFEVGAKVVYRWSHNEIEFTKAWSDGLPAAWVPQENVLAVYE